MNSKILKLLSGLAIILLLTNSCKKSNDHNLSNVDLNGVFLPSASLDLSVVQMYTINGQITNQETIKAFIISHNLSNNFFVGAQSIPYSSSNLKINFKNNTSATVLGHFLNANTDSSEYTIKQRSASGFILAAVDTTKALQNYNNRLDVFVQDANQVNGISNCVPLPTTVAYNVSVCSYRDSRPFVINNGKIYLSFFARYIVNNSGLAESNEYAFTTGVFNLDIVKQLINRDTLLVQPELLLFTRQ